MIQYFRFSFVLLLFSMSNLAMAQVSNGGMEIWEMTPDGFQESPKGWTTRDHLNSDFPGANFCSPSVDPLNGQYAAFLQNYFPSSTTVLSSFMSLGSFNALNPSQRGVPFTEKPSSMIFHYKYYTNEANPSDFFSSKASIKLTKWDPITNAQIVIGEGEFLIADKVNFYSEAVVDINYTKVGIPDTLQIVFSTPSNPNDEIRFLIDDIRLTFNTTNVEEVVSLDEISVFPNPMVSELTVFNPSAIENAQIILTDILGRTHKTAPLDKTNKIIDVEHLETGFYFYQIVKEDKILNTGKLFKS